MPDPATDPIPDAPARIVTARRLTPAERAAQLLAWERRTQREERVDIARTIVACFLWMALGLFLMSWAVHTTDQRLAGVAFWAGMVLGNGGILLTLAAAWLRAENR